MTEEQSKPIIDFLIVWAIRPREYLPCAAGAENTDSVGRPGRHAHRDQRLCQLSPCHLPFEAVEGWVLQPAPAEAPADRAA